MKFATLVVFILSVSASHGQSGDHSLKREQALADLQILQRSLEEIHPNIFRYTSKGDFDKAYQHVREQIGDSITVRNLYKLVAPIITLVRCGHTFGIAPLVDETRGLLPLDIKILNGKLFLLRNLSLNDRLPVGSELLTINGTAAIDLINAFRNTQNADGFGVNFKDRISERDFRWKYAIFFDQPDSFKIEFRNAKTGEQKQLTIASQSYRSITQRIAQLNMPKPKPLDFSVDMASNIAVMKLGSFMARNIKKQSGQNLRKTIKKSFRELHHSNIDNLIIDLRNNTGGKVFATPLLFSYLADSDFKVADKILFRHGYKFSHPEYLNRSKFSDWVNRQLDKKINDSTYVWPHHRITNKTFKVKRNAYKGKLYILTNGMTASAGAEFASILRAHSKGVFIGEETGGDYNGVNGFDRTYLRLPNSGIGILIAGWRSFMAWPESQHVGHGVVPDYEVHPTIDDLLTGQDAAMKFAYELIKNRN